MDGRTSVTPKLELAVAEIKRRPKTSFALAVTIIFAAAYFGPLALPSAAMTEFCMQDGADVKATFFAAPTTGTKPVRVVMAGYTYEIPRNYFRFPQVECRSGETRGMILRMTLPDFLPATEKTWDRLYGKSAGLDHKYIQVSASQQTIKDMARLLEIHSRLEIEGRTAPAVDGLLSLVQGPLDPNGYPVSDVYYAPSRLKPYTIIYCTPVGKYAGSICNFLFAHNGIVWSPSTSRKNLLQWREILLGLKRRIDSFVVGK